MHEKKTFAHDVPLCPFAFLCSVCNIRSLQKGEELNKLIGLLRENGWESNSSKPVVVRIKGKEAVKSGAMKQAQLDTMITIAQNDDLLEAELQWGEDWSMDHQMKIKDLPYMARWVDAAKTDIYVDQVVDGWHRSVTTNKQINCI